MSTSALLALRGSRIAHVLEFELVGGAARLASQFVEEQVAAGCPAVAFLPERAEAWLGRDLTAAGVEVEYHRPARTARRAADLAAGFRRHGVALAHSHDAAAANSGAWAALGAAIPHVVSLHVGPSAALKWRDKWALKTSFGLSAAVAVASRPVADQLGRELRLRRERIAVIPSGLRPPPRLPSTLRRELGIGDAEQVLLAIGALSPAKGHRHLVEALAVMRRQFPGAHAVIAGQGSEQAGLSAQARARGLGARVHLLGFRHDVANLLSAADVFVLPSLWEVLPLALVEAMFAGLPIVATDTGEVRAALAGGEAGLLVRPGDVDALAEALRRLLTRESEARALGACAARRAAAVYGLDGMMERYARLYAAALRRPV